MKKKTIVTEGLEEEKIIKKENELNRDIRWERLDNTAHLFASQVDYKAYSSPYQRDLKRADTAGAFTAGT